MLVGTPQHLDLLCVAVHDHVLAFLFKGMQGEVLLELAEKICDAMDAEVQVARRKKFPNMDELCRSSTILIRHVLHFNSTFSVRQANIVILSLN